MSSIHDAYHFATSAIVTIHVGSPPAIQTPKTYSLHKSLLCACSPFFAKCLSSPTFQESQTNTVHLPDDTPEAVDVFVHYIYRSDIPPANSQADVDALLHAYVLADKLCMPAFKNVTVNRVREYYSSSSAAAAPAIPADAYAAGINAAGASSTAPAQGKGQRIHLDTLVLWKTLDKPDGLPLEEFLLEKAAWDMLRRPRKYFSRGEGSAKRGDVDDLVSGQTEGDEKGVGNMEGARLVADLLWAVLNAAGKRTASGSKNEEGDPADRTGCVYHEHLDAEQDHCPDGRAARSATGASGSKEKEDKRRKKRPSAGDTPGLTADDLSRLLRGMGLL